MNYIKLLLLAFFQVHLLFQLSFCQETSFLLNQEPSNVYSPVDQLGLHFNIPLIDVPPTDIRRGNIKAPGDYFRLPKGITGNAVSETTIIEIESETNALIKRDYYNEYILDNLKEYKYRLYNDSLNRIDFFVRYSQGDTIYVISGWLGKFLSFYRAIPGIIKYDHNALQNEINKIAVLPFIIPQEILNKAPKGNPILFGNSGEKPYFIEYVDEQYMARIRCYQISEELPKPGQESSPFNSTPFTLIEITKFLDKDVMP